jgi:hypothetical protein
MKSKVLLLCAFLLVLGSVVGAQNKPTPSVPTPYSTSRFSATFNGPVTFEKDLNDAKTTTNSEWSSGANGIVQQLTIRDISGSLAIDVNQESLNFYVNQALNGATALAQANGNYQGHIWSYVSYNSEGEQWRMWFIIVNPTTVFVLSELTDIGNDDSAAWATFSKSLVIK